MIHKSFRLTASNSVHFDMGYRRVTGNLASELDHCNNVLVGNLQSGILLTLLVQPSSSIDTRGNNLKGEGYANQILVEAAFTLEAGPLRYETKMAELAYQFHQPIKALLIYKS